MKDTKKREKIFSQFDLYKDQRELATTLASKHKTTRTDIIRWALDEGLKVIQGQYLPTHKRSFINKNDKLGHGIKEGDILWDELSRGYVKVVYDDDSAAFLGAGLKDDWNQYFYEFDCSQIEIKGNIYENPEML